MFDLNLSVGENIQAIDEEALIFNESESENVVFIRTNKRFFVLIDVNKKSNFHQVLSATKAIKYLPTYDMILEFDLDDIVDWNRENDFYNCKLRDGKSFKIKTNLEL